MQIYLYILKIYGPTNTGLYIYFIILQCIKCMPAQNINLKENKKNVDDCRAEEWLPKPWLFRVFHATRLARLLPFPFLLLFVYFISIRVPKNTKNYLVDFQFFFLLKIQIYCTNSTTIMERNNKHRREEKETEVSERNEIKAQEKCSPQY